MNATAKTRKYQQNRIAKFRHNSSSTSFFNLLTSEELLDKVEELLPTHRERSFPPTETLSMFLAQAMSSDRSCQQVVNKSAVQRLSDGPIEFPWSLRIGIIIAITATPLAKLATEMVNIFRVKSGSAPLCPNCGAFMKVRLAKRGDDIGKKFWGCRNYPRCKGIISNHE